MNVVASSSAFSPLNGTTVALQHHRFWLARRAPLPLTTPWIPACSWSWNRQGASCRLCDRQVPWEIRQHRQPSNRNLWNIGTLHSWLHIFPAFPNISMPVCCRFLYNSAQSAQLFPGYWSNFQAKPTIRKLLFNWGAELRNSHYTSRILHIARRGAYGLIIL